MRDQHGKNHWNWKGGVDFDRNGYKRIYIYGIGRVYEHRYIYEIHIGRKLKRLECVHHINGDINDNRIENLQMMQMAKHIRFHVKGKPKSKEHLAKLKASWKATRERKKNAKAN